MSPTRCPGTVALLAAITLLPTLSVAQEREQKQRREGAPTKQEAGSAERAQPRKVEAPVRTESAPPRTEGPRDGSRPRRDRTDEVQRAVPRSEVPRPRSDRPAAVEPRVAPRNGYDRRDGYNRRDGYDRRDGYSGRYDNSRRYDYGGRYSYAPRSRYGSRSYYRPYVFRPRYSIGFGIFSGYPVPYTYSYPYPISVFGYRAPVAPVIVGPGSPLYGGISLEITPYDADVWVDGTWAGRVEDFDGTSQPLTLVPGTHRIEVQAPGYAPLVMDVIVQPGQVIPYRGDMRP